MDAKQLLDLSVAKVQEKKGTNLAVLQLSEVSTICDYFLLTTATNSKQAQAICDNVIEAVKDRDIIPAHLEGYQDARWILIDMGAVVLHIFQEEERQYYNLEKLWGQAPCQKL